VPTLAKVAHLPPLILEQTARGSVLLNKFWQHLPYASEQEGIYKILSGELIEGSLPSNKERIVLAWIEIHKEDPMANWQLGLSRVPNPEGRVLFAKSQSI
jgi:hypothetical protein